MEMLKTIAGIINPKAVIDIENIQSDLKYLESEGYINTEERDALRHYLGIQSLGQEYGDSIAWLIGAFYEGTNIFTPGQSMEQVKVDMQNNNIALKDLREGNIYNIDNLFHSKDAVRVLLDKLVIPPSGDVGSGGSRVNLFGNNSPKTNKPAENPYDQPVETTDVYGNSFFPNLDNE